MGLREGGVPTAPLRPWVLELDPTSGVVLRRLALPFDPAIASGPEADEEATRPALVGRELLQPTHTAVFRIDVDRWRVVDRVSHPQMAGVHSAEPTADGGFAVSCAASESVLWFDRSGALTGARWLREGTPDYGVADFRRLHHDALKPHSHHPNCAFHAAGRWWATCFETREAVTVDDGPTRRMALDGIPHDGAEQEGACWFTLVDGRVEARDPHTGDRLEALDLRELADTEQLLGWCRGLAVVGRTAWVGMTQLRSTTHREVLRVLLRGERGRKRPSRVVQVDLDRRRIVAEWPVGNAAGGTIYGVTAVSEPG